jgi:hypothetical protein
LDLTLSPSLSYSSMAEADVSRTPTLAMRGSASPEPHEKVSNENPETAKDLVVAPGALEGNNTQLQSSQLLSGRKLAIVFSYAPSFTSVPRASLTLTFPSPCSALLSSIFLVALDQTIVATALPKIVSEFNGLSQVTWVASACQ